LALQGLAHSTIKVYFSLIGNLNLSNSQHDAYHKALTPHLEQILEGRGKPAHIHNKFAFQITVEILDKIYSVLSKAPTAYQEIMLWATCRSAFFGSL